jgi:prevent-host-death family protein
MERRIGAFEARRNFGKVLNDVMAKGDQVVVERHGEEVAVVVPIHVYRNWRARRDRLFDEFEAMAARANMTEEEAEEFAREVIADVRRKHP